MVELSALRPEGVDLQALIDLAQPAEPRTGGPFYPHRTAPHFVVGTTSLGSLVGELHQALDLLEPGETLAFLVGVQPHTQEVHPLDENLAGLAWTRVVRGAKAYPEDVVIWLRPAPHPGFPGAGESGEVVLVVEILVDTPPDTI